MAEKILNTRIALKIDTLENWLKSTLPLKKGELALATVASSAGNGLTEPVVMIKVGEDGIKTFSQLDWNVYAKASDVLSACKTEAGLTAFIKNVVAASDGDLAALTTRVTTAEGEIDTLQADLNTAGTGLKAKVAVLEGLVGDDKVSKQISDAIEALNLATTYAAKEHTHTKSEITDFAHTHTKSEITDFAHNHEMGEINGLSDEFAKKVDKETGKSLIADTEIARLAAMSDGANKVEASATNGSIKIDGVETVVYTHPEKHAMSEITGLDTALAGKQDVIAENTYDAYGSAAQALEDANAHTDSELARLVGDTEVSAQIESALKVEKNGAKVEKYALATDLAAEIEAARAAEKENADAIDAIEADYLKAADKEALQNQINTIMSNPDAEGAINSINEFTQYINEHKPIAEAFRTDINKNKEDIATEKSRAEGVESGLNTRLAAVEAAVGESGSVAGDIADALAEAKKYTDDEVKELADGAVAANTAAINTLNGLVGDDEVSVQIAAVTDPLAERVVALEAVDHEHGNKALLDTYTQTEANLADAVAKKHSHANQTELDKIAEGDKAAWDAKVDSVTAAADSGLKATRTGNAVAIEIDDSITWVFDCGNASV